jgi:methionyl-tRNA synthetase
MAIALCPFLPKSAQKIWQQIGLPGMVSENQWSEISKIAVNPSHNLGDIAPVFARIEEADIKKRKEKFEKNS